MNIKALRLYISLMENLTLARACEELHTSQPAASRLLRILEDQLGEPLFQRTRKRLVPTPAAEVFLPEAIRILKSIDNIPEIFAQNRSTAARPLRILCLPRIVNALVVPAVSELSHLDCALRFKIDVCPRRDFGRRLVYGNYDIGVSSLPLPLGTIQAEVLARAALHVMLPADHPLATRQCLDLSDLMTVPYVALDEHTVVRQAVDQALARSGTTLEATHEVSTSEVASQMVRDGMGFTFVDPASVWPVMARDVAVVPWSIPASFEIGYVLSQSPHAHSARAAFIEKLKHICVQRYPVS
jgi:DNA-binding transcriptional LysR family regulator